MRAVLTSFAVIFIGDAACSSESCEIRDVVERHLGTETLVDCSPTYSTEFPYSPDLPTARRCVQAALAVDMPFVVVWDVQNIESLDTYALVHAVVDDKPTFYSIASFLEGPSPKPKTTTTTACIRFDDLGDCATLYHSLCFRCLGDAERCD